MKLPPSSMRRADRKSKLTKLWRRKRDLRVFFFSTMKRRGADRTCMGKKDKNRRNPPLDTEKCCETRFDAAATAPSRWNEKKALFWRWKASHPRSVSKRVYLHMTPEKGKEKVKGIWRKRSQQKINAIYDIHAIPTQMLTIRWRA